MRRRITVYGGALVLFCALSIGLQWARGAFDSSLAQFSDEPSHAVTGLMVKDYLGDPDPVHPVQYAEQFYVYYPKVGIGQWPPGLYLMEAGWTMVFGATRASFVFLMAVLAAAVATLVFAILKARAGPLVALLSALLFLAMPLTQQLGGSVMTEMPMALLALSAAFCFARFLETERATWSLAFGCLAALAVLTKGSGILLGLVPPIALLFHRRKWHLLRRPALWASAILVVVFCAPWYVLTVNIVRGSWGGEVGIAYVREALSAYLPGLLAQSGAAVALLVAWALVGRRVREEHRAVWSSLAALLVATLIVHSLLPTGVALRHIMVVLPAIAILFGLGSQSLGAMRPQVATAAAVVGCLFFAVEKGELTHKTVRGYEAAALDLLGDDSLKETVFLIASGPIGEGAFVSEIALNEERPGHVVLRGSKVLAHEGWLGQDYDPIFTDPQAMLRFLRTIPVAVVVLDSGIGPRFKHPYHDMLRAVLDNHPEQWELRGSFDTVVRGEARPGALRLYVLKNHRELPRSKLDYAIARGKERPGS